jgi:osmoprotectant transport system substrate-binding protein
MHPLRQGGDSLVGSCVHRLATGTVMTLLVVLGIAACGSSGTSATAARKSASKTSASQAPGSGKPAFTLGTKNFTEEFILGQLYAQALRAKGYSVRLKDDIGPSEVMNRRLSAGEIDGYPEYTGTILSVFGDNPKRPLTASQAYQLAAAVERRHDAALLAMASATDTDAVIAKPDYAAGHRLGSLADLTRLGSAATLAGPPEFRTRFSGLIGLRQAYGVTAIRFLPVRIDRQYAALANGRAQLAVAFTTDGNLTRGGYTMLSDPKNIFGFQNVTFVVRQGVLAHEGPAFAQAIDAVSARLSTQALRLMNAAVTLDGQTPAAVARQFLGANGLL